jgi:hypothetical protein
VDLVGFLFIVDYNSTSVGGGGGPCFSNNENGGFVCLKVEDLSLR